MANSLTTRQAVRPIIIDYVALLRQRTEQSWPLMQPDAIADRSTVTSQRFVTGSSYLCIKWRSSL